MAEKIRIDEKLEEGYIHIRAIVEMMGKPKEHVLETLKTYIKKLEDTPDYILVSEEYSEPEEKDGLFTYFVETELLIKSIENVAFFCFDYLPSSIEIMDPPEFKYRSPDLTGFLNDILGKLHQLDSSFKTDKVKIQKLNANTEALMKNFLGHILNKKPRELPEIAKNMGIGEEQMKLLMNRLMGEKYVKKSGEKYELVAKK